MSLAVKIRRYQIIVSALKNGRKAGMEELMELLTDHGFENSKRTIQRDLEELRTEFRLDITWMPKEKVYVLEEDSRKYLDRFLQVLELNQLAGFFSLSLQLGPKSQERIQFDTTAVRGTEFLDLILRAISEDHELEIEHFSYSKQEYRRFRLQPLLLKEYLGRWYLFAFVPSEKGYRSFGLDRIQEVWILENRFDAEPHRDSWKRFEQVIGLNYDAHDKAERIVLRADSFQAHYLESLPWHPSMKREEPANREKEKQKEKQGLQGEGESGEDGYVYFSLEVIPNYELTQKILSFGPNVEILEPTWYREKIRAEWEKGLKIYGE